MAEPYMGATVRYCGHDGTFLADIHAVGNANIVYASRPVDPATISRPAIGATHHLVDFPVAGFWRPRLGIFVVPANQVRALNQTGREK